MEAYGIIYIYISSAEFLPKGRSFAANNRRNQGCSSPEGTSSTANSGTKGCSFTRDLIGAVASRSFLYPTLSLASEQTLKDPRGTNKEVRRVDLANWAFRTSPKFATGVKHQFHQGF